MSKWIRNIFMAEESKFEYSGNIKKDIGFGDKPKISNDMSFDIHQK